MMLKEKENPCLESGEEKRCESIWKQFLLCGLVIRRGGAIHISSTTLAFYEETATEVPT